MERRQAYKFELRPDGSQKRLMSGFAGSCRFVFNKALALRKEVYEKEKRSLNYVELARQLTQWKGLEETAWLANAPSQPLQQALKDLDRAYVNFFENRAEFPKFKKKGIRDSFRFPQGFKVDQDNKRMFLPKLGWLRYRKSQEVLGTVKNITVSQVGGKWYASLQTEREGVPVSHPSGSMVGIDLGVTHFAVLSTGEVFEPVNALRQQAKKLARLQRSMSRKVKFSQNWRKAKNQVTKLHHRIGNIRNDYLHKTSHKISKNHAIVVLEDLKVANMSKSARGSSDSPGKNVKAKNGLNRSILDQGWSELRRQLEYKEEWLGGRVIAVPAQHTSQTCNKCRHVSALNRKTQARFECQACGYLVHADLNAAHNILAAGHAVLACGDTTWSARGTMAQEPTELILAEVA